MFVFSLKTRTIVSNSLMNKSKTRTINGDYFKQRLASHLVPCKKKANDLKCQNYLLSFKPCKSPSSDSNNEQSASSGAKIRRLSSDIDPIPTISPLGSLCPDLLHDEPFPYPKGGESLLYSH